MNGGSVEERSSSCAIGIPLYAATAPAHPADVRAQAPPLRSQLSDETANAAKTDCRKAKEKIEEVVISLVVLAVVILLMLSLRDSPPKFGVYSLSVSSFNISGSGEITANWDVGFLARDPNGFFLTALTDDFYEHTVVSVYYENQLLSEAVFPEIRLPSKKTISYSVNAVALGRRIEDARVAVALARDRSQGVVAFTFRLLDTSKSSPRRNVNVTCNHIKVEFPDQSSTQGTMMPDRQDSRNNTDEEQQAFSRCSFANYYSPSYIFVSFSFVVAFLVI